MSDATETTTTAARDAAGGDPTPSATPTSPEPAASASEPDANRTYSHQEMHQVREEAKKYRHRLRETEERATGLQERVDRHDRAAVERLAGERLNDAADIWLVHDVGDFRTEDGSLDEDRVTAALEDIAGTRTHWLKPAPNFDGGVRRPLEQQQSFGQVLKRAVIGHE